MLINVPIESLEERYSAQWNKWFPSEFERLGVDYLTIDPNGGQLSRIENGQFLDVVRTNIYKAAQLQTLCRLIAEGRITSGDTIFFHDLWFPGIEMLFYIRDGLDLDIKISGMLHAGTYDPHDFLTQSGMGRWAKDIETAWFNEVDNIFLATNFHASLLRDRYRKGSRARVHVTPFPLMWKNPYMEAVEKNNIVVFPHRLAPEKDPEMFDQLTEVLEPEFPDWQFVATKKYCVDKADYWLTLARAKVAISCAKQETWGIAQQEAVLSDCIPVVPDRLSYHELYDHRYTYVTFAELVSKTRNAMAAYDDILFGNAFQSQQERFVRDGEQAIERMLRLLRVVPS